MQPPPVAPVHVLGVDNSMSGPRLSSLETAKSTPVIVYALYSADESLLVHHRDAVLQIHLQICEKLSPPFTMCEGASETSWIAIPPAFRD